ncbi:MAG: aminoacyl-tRNA deacylase [Candidatus Thorarchaeota archaeon]
MDNNDLQSYIEEHNIEAEILTMEGRVHSVEAASGELGVPPERFIKTVVFIANGKVILAIVNGTDRASSKRVGKAIDKPPPKLASPEQAFELTGFEVGGTPPIAISNASVLIDTRVMEMREVIGGGGTDRHLLRIDPAIILKETNAKIIRIRK